MATRRLLLWASLGILVLMAVGAGVGSAMTAPARTPTVPSGAHCNVWPMCAEGQQVPKPPGAPCLAAPGTPTLTLTDTLPRPSLTVPVGANFTVVVPRWGWGQPTDITIVHPVVSEECSILEPDGARSVVVVARSTGDTYVGATVTPASNAEMPAWGGEVAVVP